MDFDYKALLCFKKVAELEHITKASEALYISQAQLSRIIQRLEKEFGVPLFEREGKGIRLTACGRAFYDYVQNVLESTSKIKMQLRNIYLHERAQLTLADNVAGYMVALTKAAKQQFPELTTRQISATSGQCVQYLKEGIADFAICCPGVDDPAVEQIFLMREEAVVIYPHGHWLSERNTVSLEELRQEPIIGMAEGFATRDSLDLLLGQYQFEPNYIVEISETTLVGYYVDAGLGISIVPKSLFTRNSFQLRYAEVTESLYGNVYLLWKKGRDISPTEQAFIEMTKSFFEKL